MRWFRRQPRTDFYGVAKHNRQVPAAELAVAESALAGGGPIAEQFMSQLRDARDVWRLRASDGSYELRVSTTMLVHGVPRKGWESDPIAVRALPANRPLEITLHISMAGIIEIHGRSLDGQPWPADWSLALEDREAIRSGSPFIRLPTPAELRDERARAVGVIEGWAGEPGLLSRTRRLVVVESPATTETIAAFEATEQFALPEAYRELLLVANGFEVGNATVLGTEDAYRLDIPGPDRLVIAPPDEEGALVLAPTGEVRFVEPGDATGVGRVRAPDLRTWVRRRVVRRRGDSEP